MKNLNLLLGLSCLLLFILSSCSSPRVNPSDLSVEELVRRVQSLDGDTHLSARHELVRRGSVAIPPLMKVIETELNTSHTWSTIAAINTLADMGQNATTSLPLLTRLLSDSDPGRRAESAVAIAKIGGPDAEITIPQIVMLLKDSDPFVRGRVAIALGHFHQANTNLSIAALEVAASDTDPSVRTYAVVALGAIGPAAKDALSVLSSVAANYPDDQILQKNIQDARELIMNNSSNVTDPLRYL